METIGLPKELYDKVTAVCELDAAYRVGMLGVIDEFDRPYDLDVEERRTNLHKEIESLISSETYSEYSEKIRNLLYSDEGSFVSRIQELHFRFYKLAD